MNSQKSVKIKFSLVAALALSFIIAIGAFLGITLARADRTVTISGTSIFFTDGAKVWAHQEGDEGAEKDHTMFVFDDNKDAVNFKKNLAFKWVENVAEQEKAPEKDSETEEGTEETPFNPEIHFDAKDGWFNLEIGFGDYLNSADYKVEFDKFVITFESQQYSQTKDGKSTNYIVFAPAEDSDGDLSVYVLHKETADKDLDAVLKKVGQDTLLGTVEADKHININFVDPEEHKDMPVEGGDYLVQVSNGEKNKRVGTFKNINKTYAKYSSSTTTPVTPLSFKAVFDDETEAHNAFLTLYMLNNQSFQLKDAKPSGESDNHRAGGTVNDTTPPVLCLDKAVPFIQYNKEISFDYTVIDVLTSSPSLTTSYYMLTKTGVNDTPVYNEGSGAYKGDFKTVSDSDNQYIFPHAKHYLPTAEAGDLDGTVFKNDDNFEVKAAVKVVLKLTDTTSTGGQTTYVYLDWFVDSDYLLQIGEEGHKVPYIAVTEDKQGATYAYTKDGQSKPDDKDWKDLVDAYRDKVNEAAKGLKAGSKNYFYLPSAETLFADNATAYADLTFSIYYNNGSQQQSTGKNANALSINLTKAGKYVFTIYAKDAAGNNMYYFDEDGEEQELEAGDIWSMYKEDKNTEFAGMKKYLPWFEFNVEESELSIEDPDEQSTAYVGSSYTPDSFEINGVSVKTEYKLYEFNNDEWAKAKGEAMTYEEFSERVATLLLTDRQYFTLIRPTGDLKEGTKDYEDFNEYGWDGSSLSFTPQTANTFYVIKCEAKRSANDAEPETSYMTIAAAPKVNPLKGEDTWVQDNITSIILLCIAGASLIGIILLLVIKPKNNGDIDEVIDTPKRSRKTK